MADVTRTISLKHDIPKQVAQFELFYDQWGHVQDYVTDHIHKIHLEHQKLQIKKDGKCKTCKKNTELCYEPGICNACFARLWSRATLTKVSDNGFFTQLKNAFPDLSVHSGYYGGCIKYGIQAYASYVTKVEDNRKEEARLKSAIESEQNSIRKEELSKKYKQVQKGIKKLEFKCNVIYLGSASMFDFRCVDPEKGIFELGVADIHTLRKKKWFRLKLGREIDYTKHTVHNKVKIIQDCIKTKKHKELFGKLLRRKIGKEYIYEFMLPYHNMTKAFDFREEESAIRLGTKKIERMHNKIEEASGEKEENKLNEIIAETEERINEASHNIKTITPDTTLIVATFGLKNIIRASVYKQGKKLITRKFGDGQLLACIEHAGAHRRSVKMKFRNRHVIRKNGFDVFLGIWKRKKNLNNYWRRYKSESGWLHRYIHDTITEFVEWVKAHYEQSIIVYRDMKGIKKINYQRPLNEVFHKWPVEMYKTLLEYKAMLRDISIFPIRYATANKVTCPKCNRLIIMDGAELSWLTCWIQEAKGGVEKQKNYIARCKRTMKNLRRKVITERTVDICKKITRDIGLAEKMLENYEDARPPEIVFCQSCNHHCKLLHADHEQLKNITLTSLSGSET